MNLRNRDRVIGAASRGGRVSAHVKLHCGDMVYDKADPRHIARVEAVIGGWAMVRFIETGWRGEIRLRNTRRQP